ncbi:hypothetical protein ACTS95_12775 [Empedobacter brevis]
MANTERINDFMTFYESNNLDFEEKKSVLALIVTSYNGLFLLMKKIGYGYTILIIRN